MSVLPIWLIGEDVTGVTLTKQSVASDGTLSADGSAISITTSVDKISLEQYSTTENIVPMTQRQDNEVPYASGTRLRLTEILSLTSKLNKVGQANDIVQATFVQGDDVFGPEYFVILGYTQDLGRSKNTGELSLGPCGVAGSGFTVSS